MSLESFPEIPQTPANSAESREGSPETEAREVLLQSRWNRIINSEEIKQGLVALTRTLINAGVSVADTFPVIGGAASFAADSLKSYKVQAMLRFIGLPNLDLTPSVSRSVAWGSEALELVSLGTMPSHLVESTLQFTREDYGRIKAMLIAAKEIAMNERTELDANRAQLDAAANEFRPS